MSGSKTATVLAPARQITHATRHNRNPVSVPQDGNATVPRETRSGSQKSCVAPGNPLQTTDEKLKNAVYKNGVLVFDAKTQLSPNTRHKDYPLYDYAQLPRWLEGNPFIQSYYRCGYSTMMCIKSIFAVHNETMNIWIHAVGFMITLCIAVHVMFQMELGRKRDFLVFSLLELGSLCMLGGSSVYHTLAAHHSSTVHNCALAFDYFGITLMIVGSFYPPVFYLFSCTKEIRLSYFVVVTTLGFVSLLGPVIWPLFNTEKFYYVRLFLFTGTAVVGGLMPGLHTLYSLPTNDYTSPVYHGMLLSLGIYFVGMVFYMCKIPECFFPGAFDLMLSSHQLWHFFVLCAAVVQYFTSIAAFQLWRVTGDAGGECV